MPLLGSVNPYRGLTPESHQSNTGLGFDNIHCSQAEGNMLIDKPGVNSEGGVMVSIPMTKTVALWKECTTTLFLHSLTLVGYTYNEGI